MHDIVQLKKKISNPVTNSLFYLEHANNHVKQVDCLNVVFKFFKSISIIIHDVGLF